MDRNELRFGISFWLDDPVDAVTHLASAAESAGFDDVWVPDHYFLRDAYIAQALIAQATKRVRIGAAVAAAQLRHPALLASATATIDELSDGRAILGLGPGGHEFSTQFDMKPKSPLSLVRDSVNMARGLFAGGADVDGRALSARGARLNWQTRADIPIYLAARGTKMLQLAGEIADGVLVHGISTPYIEHVRSLVAQGAKRAGRSADACEVGVILDVEVDDDEQLAIDRMRRRLTVMAGGSYPDELIELYELDRAEVERLRHAVRADDPEAYKFVTDAIVNAFALAGSPQSLVKRCHALHEAGLSNVVVFTQGDQAHALRQINGLRPIIEEVRS